MNWRAYSTGEDSIDEASAALIMLAIMQSPLHGGQRQTTDYGADNTLPKGEGQHMGVDIDFAQGDSDLGAPVYSTAYGTVVQVDTNPQGDFGSFVVVEHNIAGVKFYSIYAHLDATTVDVGQTVGISTQIGDLGGTPDFAVHLHFEVRTVVGAIPEGQATYSGLRVDGASFWADTPAEASSNWLDISSVFGGYSDEYPEGWPTFP